MLEIMGLWTWMAGGGSDEAKQGISQHYGQGIRAQESSRHLQVRLESGSVVIM